MEKRVVIEFSEQSKAVTSSVKIEYSGEGIPSNTEILSETTTLFDEAQRHALNKSILRNK
jgi:hypothetical protein